MAYKSSLELVSSKTFPKITINVKPNNRINWVFHNGSVSIYKDMLIQAINYVKLNMVEYIHRHGRLNGKNPKITLKMNLNNENKIIWAFMNGSKLEYVGMLEHVMKDIENKL